MIPSDFARRVALAELLAQPDPPELDGRGNYLRLPGKPDRYAMVPTLMAAFVQSQLVELRERQNVVWGT